MAPRLDPPAASRRPALLGRVLRAALITGSLLLCLTFAALWYWSEGTDRSRTWQSGRRSFQVASWDGRLEYRVVGDWLNDQHAQRGTTLLARHSGFAFQPGAELMQRYLAAQRDALVAAAAAHPSAPAGPRPRQPGFAYNPLLVTSAALANLSDTLITDRDPRARSFAGVITVERQTCRLPVTNDAGQTTFDPPVPVLSIYAPCWLPVVLFGALPAFALLRAAGHNYRQRHRLNHHRCPACGYDVRATPGNCPECGAQFQSPAPTPTPPQPHSPV